MVSQPVRPASCYNSGEPGWYESGERETTSVCVGTREGRSGDCGRRARSWRCSLSRRGGNDNDNPIRKINNKNNILNTELSLWTPLLSEDARRQACVHYRDLEPGDILGTASAPLLRVPLEALAQYDAPINVTPVAESLLPSTSLSETTNATPDPPDEPPLELLHRLDDDQRTTFLRLWNTVPPHIRRIEFALDAPGWEPSAIDALSATLEYADIFSSSKLDYGACSLQSFEIKVPPGTQPIQSRPYRLNPILSNQVDAILDSYLAAGLIQHSTSPWSSPLVCVLKKSGGIRITVNYQKLNKVTEIPQMRSSASMRSSIPSAAA